MVFPKGSPPGAIISVLVPKRSPQVSPQVTTQGGSQIQNDSSLSTVGSELDNTDVDEIDTQLNQIDTEASSF